MNGKIRWVVGAGAMVVCGLVATAGVGRLASEARPERLPIGVEKAFGFFDPHLHAAVTRVAMPENWRGSGGPVAPSGVFYLVTVETRSDAARIDVDAGGLKIVAIDDAGLEHEPLRIEGERDLATALAGVLHPGDARVHRFLFDLPRETVSPALWVTYPDWLERVLPDHEHGWLGRPIYFALR